MKLQKKIHTNLKESMKAKNEAKTSALRVLIGEFQRQPQKELDDSDVLSIIRKLIKAESEMLAKSGKADSDYMSVLKSYMPAQPSETDIKEWILNNIDFGRYNNKMQAMRPTMAHFAGSVDGNTIKKILESF